MSFSIKLNKSKQIAFRINPKGSGIDFILTLPGVTITVTKKASKGKINSQTPDKQYAYTKIHHASIYQFQPAKYRSLISKISRLIKLNTLTNWLCPISLLMIILLIMIFLLPLSIFQDYLSTNSRDFIIIILSIIAILGIFIKIYVHTIGRIKLENYIDVNQSKASKSTQANPWLELLDPEKLWQITGVLKLQEEDQRENAGSTTRYERYLVKRKVKSPFYLNTKQRILQLKLKEETLIITPGLYLIINKSKVGITDASDITHTSKAAPYAETEDLPKDAQVLEYTWQYVNKDGSKDKRYKQNNQVPICNYGLLKMESENGFQLILLSSSIPHK